MTPLASRKIRIAPLPPWRENPYLDLFYGNLPGVEMIDPIALWPPEARDRSLAEIDGVHFHWPEVYWRDGEGRTTWRRLFSFWRLLMLLKKRGKRTLWTVHNFVPHEGSGTRDRIARGLLARHADLVICHDRETLTRLRADEPQIGNVIVMPHGNYDGDLPRAAPRGDVAARLGLDPTRPVVAMIGLLRDYKGFETALAAVLQLPGVQLLIAGRAHESFDASALRVEVDGNPDMHLVERFLSEQEISDFHAVSDLILLPYRNITGSGALLMALTQGRAVVASDLPFFRETLDGVPDAGRLVAPGDPAAFAEAVRAALAVPGEERNTAARRLADRYAWPRVAKTAAGAIHDLFARATA